MTRLLHNLQSVRAFAPTMPFGEPLAAVHVRFDELTHSNAHEARVALITDSDGLVLVIGESGEGKSGLVSSALSISGGRLAVPVPVSVPHPAGAAAADLPGLVLDGLSNLLWTIDADASDQAQRAASRSLPARQVNAALDLKVLKVDIDDILATRRQMGRAEQLDALHQAMEACREGGLRPVLVLDDTDKWSLTEERVQAGRTFFDEAFIGLAELGLPIAANAHPRYFSDAHPPPDRFDGLVHVPRIDEAGVSKILHHRIETATDGEAGLDQVFEADALDRIVCEYTGTSIPMRRLIQLCSEAMLEAIDAGLAMVGIGAVEAAIANRR